MNNIAFITCARMDSKRLPGKCLRPLNGKPLIEYTLDFAESFYMPVYVWTRDAEIMEATKGRASVIYEPLELYDTPHNSTMEKMQYANKIIQADILIILQPTSPIRDRGLVINWINHFKTAPANYAESFFKKGSELISNGAFFAFKKKLLDGTEQKIAINYIDKYFFDINTQEDMEGTESWLKRQRPNLF